MTTTPPPLPRTGLDDGVDVLASDGKFVTIRPVRPEDMPFIDRVFGPDPDRKPAVVALDGPHVIGVAGRRPAWPIVRSTSESVLVSPAHRGRGIATLMAEQLPAAARPAKADRRSGLSPLLAPRSVAVAGAGRRHGGAGHEILRALRDYGFRGHLYAVTGSGLPVCGVPGYRRLRDVPEPLDLLVIATPADQVADVIAAAADAGVRAAAVLSPPRGRGGGPAGRGWPELLRTARRHGMRLIGPDSLGLLSTDPRVRLDAGLAATRPPPGGLAVLVESGAVGIALLDQAVQGGCGISSFVSLGHGGGVPAEDVLAHWYDDPGTRAVAIQLESYDGTGRLGPAVRALARRKPVLTIGRALPRAPSGSVGEPQFAEETLLRQTGILRTGSAEELVDTARMLAGQPLPAGDRLAILGNAGGLTALAAETARTYGFRIVPLSPDTRAELPSVNDPASRDNPVDLGVGAAPALIAEAAETVAAGGDADILLLMVIGTRANVPVGIMTALRRIVDDHPGLTVAAVLTGHTDERASLGRRAVPIFREPERALRALAHARRYAMWRRKPLGRRPALPGMDAGRARALIGQALADGGGWLPYRRTADILSAYGIRVTPGMPARTGAAATMAARGLSSGRGTGDPRLGRTDLALAPGPSAGLPLGGTAHLEVSLLRDPLFGPVIRLRHGGAAADDPAGQVFRMVPLTDRDAADMRGELRGPSEIAGPGSAAAVEDLLLRLGRLAEDLPEVAEADLSPVVVGPRGAAAAHARLRLTRGSTALRPPGNA